MSSTIKLSSRETHEFWEIDVLYEDDFLLALNKPSLLLTSPDRYDPNRPNLMRLLHRDIERGAPWAAERKLSYLMNAHRLDFETSGVILLAKTKPMLIHIATLFGSEKPVKTYVALAAGTPSQDTVEIDAKLGPHPIRLGEMRVDPKGGKRSKTVITVEERFRGYTLFKCRPLTGRTHQIRVHMKWIGHPILGDRVYGGPPLLLSRLKPAYRLKPKREERPLLSSVALHAEQLQIVHPETGADVIATAPRPKDFSVAVKYLRRYAGSGEFSEPATQESPSEHEDDSQLE